MKAVYRKYRREWSALLALVVTIILFSVLESAYLSVSNLTTIITQAVTYGLMGIGMTCVIITGGIDLSVGSALALVACIGAQLAKAGLPIPVWVIVCLAMGFLLGAINGFLVGTLKLQPFVATMGTMSIYRGISYVITGGFPVLSVPRQYRNVFNFQITPTMTFSVVVFLVFAVIMTIVLKKTKLGAHTYAIGGNEDAARLSGVRVDRTKFSFMVWPCWAPRLPVLYRLAVWALATLLPALATRWMPSRRLLSAAPPWPAAAATSSAP